MTATARELLDAHVHKTLATLRRDGSPRISGIEAKFIEGDLWIGSMPGARKGADLRRDPRFALHSGSDDPPGWRGDAKLSGIVERIGEPEERRRIFVAMGAAEVDDESDLFRLDILELVVTRVSEAGDMLEIDLWSAADGQRSLTRK